MSLKLSIIVPAFNRKTVLEPCLVAILPQLQQGEELIVVDDASDWPVREFLTTLEEKEAQLKVYHLQANSGQGHARNHGAALASSESEVLVFIDSDVEILPDTLTKIRHFFELYSDAAALTGRLCPGEDGGKKTSFFSDYKNTYMNYIFGLQSGEVNFLYGSICAIRTHDFIPWPEKFLGVEDTELGMKMVRQGKKLVFMPELEVTHLKNYGLLSLLKNDFLVPFGFGRCFWLFAGWRAYVPFLNLVQEEKFSHIKPFQVYSLLTVSLLLAVSAFVPYQVALGLGIFYLLLNARFFWFVFQIHSLPFLLASIAWTFVDQLVMFLGAIAGLIYHGTYLGVRKLFTARPVGDGLEK